MKGMCATGALARRKTLNQSELPNLKNDDPLWDTCAYYLAALCANLVLIASPERIMIGGGVMQRTCLYEKIQVDRLFIYVYV